MSLSMVLRLVALGLILQGADPAPCAADPDPSLMNKPASARNPVRSRRRPGITGDLRVHRKVPSQYVTHARDVAVWLPPGYNADKKVRYPVLYCHDGNNMFDPATGFMGREWHMDEIADALITRGRITPLIVVGVYNTPARVDEYTWRQDDDEGQPMGGDGPAYARFLIEELKPMIDRVYRTSPDAADTATIGSSLGALAAGYLAIEHPKTFGRAAMVSPSIWWAERAMLKDVHKIAPGLRLWICMGFQEGEPGHPPVGIANARALRHELEQRGYVVGHDLGYFEDPQGGHDEMAWSHRLPSILEFLFPNRTSTTVKVTGSAVR